MNTKRVLACIIVRMKSERLKEKALLDLGGRTMTEQLIKRLKLSKSISTMVLCTSTNPSDAILLEKAKEWGVESYAGHEEDVLSRLIEASKIYDADLVLRVTGDNPFTDAANIDRLVEHHIRTNADYTRTNRLPLGVTAEVMSASMLQRLYNLMPDPCQSEYMSFYSFNPDEFHCEVLEPMPDEDRPFYSLTVDYPADLELARKLYSKLALDGGVPDIKSVIKELDNDPDYEEVSADSEIKLPNGKVMSYGNLIKMLDELAHKARKKNNTLAK